MSYIVSVIATIEHNEHNSIDNAVSQIQSQIPNLKTPGNIDINGTLSGVQSQAQAAVNGAVQQLAGKVN